RPSLAQSLTFKRDFRFTGLSTIWDHLAQLAAVRTKAEMGMNRVGQSALKLSSAISAQGLVRRVA
ncbi:MAG TPA: hypothetical protein VKA15_18930, partial [Isosphaeraceae bacterium]|nr:hypothetical protein [Isosphaeraceae bacterium]